MPTSGPNYATNTTSVAGGDGAWTNPSNANASDSVFSIGFVDGSELGISDTLKTLGFGFAIPSLATIAGIEVEIRRKVDAGTSGTKDETVQLVKSGAGIGSNKAVTGTSYNSTAATVTYGGASDLWGASWTAADVNAADFGVLFRVQQTSSADREPQVDFIRVTVHYTETGDAEVGVWGSSAGSFFLVMGPP